MVPHSTLWRNEAGLSKWQLERWCVCLFHWLKTEGVCVCVRNSSTCTLHSIETSVTDSSLRSQSRDKCSASSYVSCISLRVHERDVVHTAHCSWLCVICLFSLMNGEQRCSTATRTHGDSHSTLSATTPFVSRIYLSVPQQAGKSLTPRALWDPECYWPERERLFVSLCLEFWKTKNSVKEHIKSEENVLNSISY